MKQYLLFVGTDYYPGGGWNDFADSFDSSQGALDELKKGKYSGDWFQIIDSVKSEIVGKEGRVKDLLNNDR